MVVAALYLLKMLQRTLWGPLSKEENRHLADLSWREIMTLVPLAILMLWIGVAPKGFIQPSSRALEVTLERFRIQTTQEPPKIPRLALSSAAASDDLSEEDPIE